MIIEYPTIDPVAISIFGLAIRWYALAYLAGFIGGWYYVRHLTQSWHLSVVFTKDIIDDFLVWAVLGAVLGGRMGYVLFYNLPYYASFCTPQACFLSKARRFHCLRCANRFVLWSSIELY